PPSQGGDTGSNPVGAAKNQQVRGHFGGRDTAGRAGTGGRAPRTGRATCVPEEQGVFLRNAEAPDRPARSPTGAPQERRVFVRNAETRRRRGAGGASPGRLQARMAGERADHGRQGARSPPTRARRQPG